MLSFKSNPFFKKKTNNKNINKNDTRGLSVPNVEEKKTVWKNNDRKLEQNGNQIKGLFFKRFSKIFLQNN